MLEDIIEIDDEKRRLPDSLKSYLSLDQHTDMMTGEEKSMQHTEVLLKGKEVQRPDIFYYNDFLIIEDVVAQAGTYLAQEDSQMKEEEEEHLLKDEERFSRGTRTM